MEKNFVIQLWSVCVLKLTGHSLIFKFLITIAVVHPLQSVH